MSERDTPLADLSPDWRRGFEWVERELGGRVRNLRRQGRWRPAWFFDLERAGKLVPLYFRGSRGHAEGERVGRWRTRIETLPPGEAYPYRIHLWRAGDGIWIGVEGEPYNLLQSALRERFPGVPIVVSALSTGGFALYLPERETYGKGIYQESVALLEPGCLERVIEVAGDGIEKLLRPSG